MKGKLTRNISGSFIRLFFAGLINLASLSLIAQQFNPDSVGIYFYSIVLPMLLIALLNFGLPSSIIYHCSRGQMSLNDAIKDVHLYGGFCSLIGLILGISLIALGAFNSNDVNVIYLCLFSFPFMLINLYAQSIFQAFEMFKEYNLCMLLQPVLFLIGILLLIYIEIEDVEYLGLAHFFSHSVAAISCYLWLQATKKYMPKHTTSSTFKERLRYGMKTYTGNLTAFLNYRADIYILGFFAATASIGFYSVAAQIAEKFWLLSTAIGTVLFPFLSRKKGEGIDNANTLALAVRIVFALNILVAIIFYFIGRWFVGLLLGEDFIVVYSLILILLPGIISGSVAKIIAVEFSASGRPDLNYKVSLFILFVNVFCNLLFIPVYGYIAAVYVCSFSYCLNLMIKISLYRKLIHFISLTDIFILKPIDIAYIQNIAFKRSSKDV